MTIVYCYLQAGQFLPLRGKEEQEPFTGPFVIIIIIISYYSLFKNRRPLPAPFLSSKSLFFRGSLLLAGNSDGDHNNDSNNDDNYFYLDEEEYDHQILQYLEE